MILEREPSTGMEVQVVGGAKQKSTSSTTGGGGNGSVSKKRSPKSPRKSRPNPEVVAPEVVPEKPREKRHHKDKRSHRKHHAASSGAEQEQNQGAGGKAKTGDGSKAARTAGSRTGQDSQRRSIRRQSQVDATEQLQHGSHSGRKSKIPEEMAGAGSTTGTGGGVISGAELSDVFDEESQHQYYPEDSDIKYMEDRSNCRKK